MTAKFPTVTKLPSGKFILHWLDDRNGELTCETHVYPGRRGGSMIGIRMRFEHGRKVGEMYFGGGIRHRQDYEELREKYPDMPAADASVMDDTIEQQAKEERRKREWAEAAVRLGLDPSKTTEAEMFCAVMMEKGERANSVEWIQAPNHTLGEMDEGASRELIAKLRKLGAVAIHACKIDSYEGGRQNTGHLVVELPPASPARTRLMKQLDRLARKQGFGGEPTSASASRM